MKQILHSFRSENALKNDQLACFYIQGSLNNNKISIGNVKFSPFLKFLIDTNAFCHVYKMDLSLNLVYFWL